MVMSLESLCEVTDTAVLSREVLFSELHSLLKSPKKQRSCPKKLYARSFILRGESAEYAWGTFRGLISVLTRFPTQRIVGLASQSELVLYIAWSATCSYSATSVSVKR